MTVRKVLLFVALQLVAVVLLSIFMYREIMLFCLPHLDTHMKSVFAFGFAIILAIFDAIIASCLVWPNEGNIPPWETMLQVFLGSVLPLVESFLVMQWLINRFPQ